MLGAGRKLSALMAPFAVSVSKIFLRIIKIIDSFEKTVKKAKYTFGAFEYIYIDICAL